MDVHEERALDEGASATNSQSEADVGERSGQPQQSQTPPLRSAVASDADDEKDEDRVEETSGTLWGHARLPQSVYGNNPAATGKRKSTNNAVWNVVKHLKEHTAHSVVVDTKYTHVCVAPITASEAGELGADVDSDGNSLWFCNKVFTLSKTKNCYRSSQATRHCVKFHWDTSSAGKALADRTSHNNTHKRHDVLWYALCSVCTRWWNYSKTQVRVSWTAVRRAQARQTFRVCYWIRADQERQSRRHRPAS